MVKKKNKTDKNIQQHTAELGANSVYDVFHITQTFLNIVQTLISAALMAIIPKLVTVSNIYT